MTLFILSLLLVVPLVCSDSYDKVLRFPETASLENYVVMRPDFSQARDAISVCSWLKISVDSGLPWFSYATTVADNTLLIKAKYANILRTTTGSGTFTFADIALMKNEWYHICFTWSSGEMDFYINSILVTTEGTAPTGQMILDGTLVIGQEQDSQGGSFDIGDLFGGDMYQINVFKKKLSGEEVSGMFFDGRCADIERSLSYDIVLSWDDIMESGERHGEVSVEEADCNKWGVLDDLSHLMVGYLNSRRS